MSPSDIAFIVIAFAVLILWIAALYRARRADERDFSEKSRKLSAEQARLKQESDALRSQVAVLEDRLASAAQREQEARAAVIVPPAKQELDAAVNRAFEAEEKLDRAKRRVQNLNYEKNHFKELFEQRDTALQAVRAKQQSVFDLYMQAAKSAAQKPYIKNSFVCRAAAHAETETCVEKIAAADADIDILPTTDLCFEIRGTSGAVYHTTLNVCTCPDFQHRHQPCKHMYRIALELGLLADLGERIRKQVFTYAEEAAALQEDKKKAREVWNRQRAIANQKKQTFPYLADLFAELEHYEAEAAAVALRTKSFPAVKKAEEIASNGRKLVNLRRENKSLRYQLNYLKNTVPWLEEFITLPPAQAYAELKSAETESEYDLYREWLKPGEWNTLEISEKFQLALDRYKAQCEHGSPAKTAWAAGVEYERYIGYRYEQHGFSVHYTGATEGLCDLGRDLIAKKGERTLIVQCKRWNTHKTVHEKHVFQLYGTLEKYRFEHPQEQCVGVFISTADLSPVALDAARFFQIETRVIPYSADYPMIKCNISATGERIYHLPMDQQYDRIVIEPNKGECYAATVREAEKRGFRRAKKWNPNREESR